MKRILGGLIVMILTAVIANAQSGKIEQEVLKLEQQWQDALLKGDSAALEKLVRMDIRQYFWLHRRWKNLPRKK